MKTNKIILSFLAAVSVLATSCIKETFPLSSTVTADQVAESPTAVEATVAGIASATTQGYYIYGKQTHEADMAIPGLFIQMDENLGDLWPGTNCSNTGYDWFHAWATNSGCAKNSYMAYIGFFSLYKMIKGANSVISILADAQLNDNTSACLASAYAYRAWFYYLLTNLYYPVENEYTTISDNIKGLTVPIVTETTTEKDSQNNPRVSAEEMFAFILSDLQKAEDIFNTVEDSSIKNPKASSNTPDLAVVWGLKAKTYLVKATYAPEGDGKADLEKAVAYADSCITKSGNSVLTSAQWENPTSGFCDATANSSWMWHGTYSAENMSNLCNFTGWVSCEADWGYANLTFPSINRWLYDRIADGDWRANTFKDPAGYGKYNYKTCRDQKFVEGLNSYASLKFRCKGGDWENYAVGGACDVPYMRIEEMYLIKAEALLSVEGVDAGKAALEDFMKTRLVNGASYGVPADFTTLDQVREEIIFQKRIEFFGEGICLFDAKRLKLGYQGDYEGTNAPAASYKFNCNGIKPNWNWVISYVEGDSNAAITDETNNPDPTNAHLSSK